MGATHPLLYFCLSTSLYVHMAMTLLNVTMFMMGFFISFFFVSFAYIHESNPHYYSDSSIAFIKYAEPTLWRHCRTIDR